MPTLGLNRHRGHDSRWSQLPFRGGLFLRRFYLTIALLSASTALLGAPWTAESGLMAPATEEGLRAALPTISHPDQLVELLQLIHSREPMERLEVNYVDGTWRVSGMAARIVERIQVSAGVQSLAYTLDRQLQRFVGNIDSAETERTIRDAARNHALKRGYPAAQVTVTRAKKDEMTAIVVNLAEGEPCVIARIVVDMRIPRGLGLQTKQNDVCDLEQVEADVERLKADLREEGYVDSTIEPPRLEFTAATKTAVMRVVGTLGPKARYEFVEKTGGRGIGDLFGDDLAEDITPAKVSPYAVVPELLRKYQKAGFAEVTIDPPEIRTQNDRERVYVYAITPGIRYHLRDVYFEGATVFSRAQLLDFVGLSGFWSTSPPLDTEALAASVDKIRSAYAEAGYWDVIVREPRVSRSPSTQTADVFYLLHEGFPRLVRSVAIQGNKNVPTEEIQKILALKANDPLPRAKLSTFESTVKAEYLRRGYLSAEVSAKSRGQRIGRQHWEDIEIAVHEGTGAIVGRIHIVGLARTRPQIVSRELFFQTGDRLDPEAIEMSRKSLLHLGLFRSVQIVYGKPIRRDDTTSVVDITIDVREGQRGSAAFGPGWSLREGFRWGAEASYGNFLGEARQVSAKGSLSEELDQKAINNRTLVGRNLGVTYLEPYIFSWPVNATATASQIARAHDFWEISENGEIALSHRLKYLLRGGRIATFYGQNRTRNENQPIDRETLIATGNTRSGRTGFRLIYDSRDNLAWPTSGQVFQGETRWARYELGGNIRYFRWEGTSNHFVGFASDFVYALSLSATAYSGVEHLSESPVDDVIPSAERLHAGGSSVRGYGERELGPVVTKPNGAVQALGGSSRVLVKNEMRYRVNQWFGLGFFLDVGNVFLSDDEVRKFTTAYQQIARDKGADPVAVEDNSAYTGDDIARDPTLLWTQSFSSLGLAASVILGLNVNISYGFPFAQPRGITHLRGQDRYQGLTIDVSTLF